MMNPLQFKRTADLLHYKALFTSEGEKFSNLGKAQDQSVWFQPGESLCLLPFLVFSCKLLSASCAATQVSPTGMVHSFLLYILLQLNTRVGNCKEKLLKSLRLTLVYFQVSANISGSCSSCMCYYDCHRKPQTSRRHGPSPMNLQSPDSTESRQQIPQWGVTFPSCFAPLLSFILYGRGASDS